METILVTLAVIAGGVWLAFAAHRLGEAHSRLTMLRAQRRNDMRRRHPF
ncbi:MAG: hypothetical protein V4484_18275 [Pseudomonadota bacterium]